MKERRRTNWGGTFVVIIKTIERRYMGVNEWLFISHRKNLSLKRMKNEKNDFQLNSDRKEDKNYGEKDPGNHWTCDLRILMGYSWLWDGEKNHGK